MNSHVKSLVLIVANQQGLKLNALTPFNSVLWASVELTVLGFTIPLSNRCCNLVAARDCSRVVKININAPPPPPGLLSLCDPGRGLRPVDRAVGQAVWGRVTIPHDHQVHPRQLLPGQPGGQWLPTGQLPVAGPRRHVRAARRTTRAGRWRSRFRIKLALFIALTFSVTFSTNISLQ